MLNWPGMFNWPVEVSCCLEKKGSLKVHIGFVVQLQSLGPNMGV